MTSARCLTGLVGLALGAMTADAQATSGALKGYVRVKDTATPLTIAEVEIPALRIKTRTDAEGTYEFPALPAGRYLVIARAIGFSPRGDSIAISAAVEQTRHFELPRATTQLDTAMILAPAARYISPALRGFEERRSTGLGRFIGEDELRRSDDKAFAEVIRRLPGMAIIRLGQSSVAASSRRQARSGRALEAPSNGKASCYTTIYQDGVLVYDQGLMEKAPPPTLEHYSAREYAGIEFYAGEASIPAQFRTSPCGTLLLWTRER